MRLTALESSIAQAGTINMSRRAFTSALAEDDRRCITTKFVPVTSSGPYVNYYDSVTQMELHM